MSNGFMSPMIMVRSCWLFNEILWCIFVDPLDSCNRLIEIKAELSRCCACLHSNSSFENFACRNCLLGLTCPDGAGEAGVVNRLRGLVMLSKGTVMPALIITFCTYPLANPDFKSPVLKAEIAASNADCGFLYCLSALI